MPMKFNWFPLYHSTKVQYQKSQTNTILKNYIELLDAYLKIRTYEKMVRKTGSGRLSKGNLCHGGVQC